MVRFSHICGKCNKPMQKGTGLMVVPLYHRIMVEKEGTTQEGRSFHSVTFKEKSNDGTIEKRTVCYTCPTCGCKIFYGDDCVYGKDQIIKEVD